jgi:hypothetical protein
MTLLIGGAISAARLRKTIPKEWKTADRPRRFTYLMTTYLPLSYLGFATTCGFVSFGYLSPLYVLVAFTVGLHHSARELLAAEAADGAGANGIRPPTAGYRGSVTRAVRYAATAAGGRRGRAPG